VVHDNSSTVSYATNATNEGKTKERTIGFIEGSLKGELCYLQTNEKIVSIHYRPTDRDKCIKRGIASTFQANFDMEKNLLDLCMCHITGITLATSAIAMPCCKPLCSSIYFAISILWTLIQYSYFSYYIVCTCFVGTSKSVIC